MDIIPGEKLIVVKQEVIIRTTDQPSFATTVSEVEGGNFWIKLPREGSQVLMLRVGQKVTVSVSLLQGYYTASTRIVALGEQFKDFYALAIPNEFTRTEEARFVRSNYSANVRFERDGQAVQTSLVNFTAEGMMVYLVPDLESLLQKPSSEPLYVILDFLKRKIPVRLSWQEVRNNISFAGFQFMNLPAAVVEEIDELASKYSDPTMKGGDIFSSQQALKSKKQPENLYPTLTSKWKR
ncbi:flagellar brake domain-containing protein [Desulforamulus ruminis]|uniref:Type IV pilus assembly PilZ n=1 Tax=Desulforamulus ruminis (strain ATCC 23193 / DSM 2154 / NCIMB 8452 / DL) TaxID=696281 RepID=F6DQL4_DESRL|nr:PilZ domain-containing protein [Desulforamulus ruminis]AEG62011.1 type IV pilus assembly PilZ [Desulforamulus ruminis DSM 2154]